MKKYLFLFLILQSFTQSLFSQSEIISVKQGCQFNGEPRKFDEEVYGFSSTQEAEDIVNKILAEVGSNARQAKFIIRSASVDNAEAVIDGNRRIILYNPDFMLRVGNIGDWAATSILAHEIGHHFLGHTLEAAGSRPTEELDADEWSGFILCKLGASLDQAQAAIKTLVKEVPTGKTHPGRAVRIAAIANGFARAKCKAEPPKATDTDGDGFADNQDDCPNEYGTLRGCKDLPEFVEMVKVQGGTFQMGSNYGSDEKPVHSVTLSTYYIGRTEVTQKQWTEIMGTNPSSFKGCDDCPVESVSWNDIQSFLQKLNARYPNKNYRLPTEAEWEFAARGGKNSNGYTYAGSNSVGNVAWLGDNSGSKTHPVAQKTANELGIYDMSGNVWEWCSDWYGTYSSSSQTNPKGASSGSDRVGRGGSWNYGSGYCTASYRSDYSPALSYDGLGFRLSRTE